MEITNQAPAAMDEGVVYNALHAETEAGTGREYDMDLEDDELEAPSPKGHGHGHGHSNHPPVLTESLNYFDTESIMWRRHQFRRYFQSKGRFWTPTRVSTFWKWTLVVGTGLVTGLVGCFVSFFTHVLDAWKYESVYELMNSGNHGGAFFAVHAFNLLYILCACAFCYWQPLAAGSGIPEVRAFLNGVDLSAVIQVPVVVAKIFGMCFSSATGIPLGKEGPMIHAGAIIGGAISQLNLPNWGYDTSWNQFQDLRNDHVKRDYVTYGAAAGVGAAFRSPLGGILFTMEEGASFWSLATTFRSFMCAVITVFTLAIVYPSQATSASEMFAFGRFDNFYSGRSNFFAYELPIFALIGALGGVLGALFNHVNKNITLYRMNVINKQIKYRVMEAVAITMTFTFLAYILSICWQVCTPVPEYDGMTDQEEELAEELVRFQCRSGYYNQLASLFVAPAELTMRQLFHSRELQGFGTNSFTTGPLIMFFVPYFFLAMWTAGGFYPCGMFVPTLCSGAALGRLLGHWLNVALPGSVADSGTYALIGAASILGGTTRMSISGAVILLEACGNAGYLLPLMFTLAAARYTGNAIGLPTYDMLLTLKRVPFLEDSLHTLGMLNQQPVKKIMTDDVITLCEVDRVSRVYEVLTTTKHHGFPVVDRQGHLRGFILRKTLTSLLKMKAYSTPTETAPLSDGGLILAPAATIFYDTIEKVYPNYPTVESLRLTDREMNFWLDVRAHMDGAPLVIHEGATVRRAYLLFRTMGLRHLTVVDGFQKVVGILTRIDLNEHHLEEFWHAEEEAMQHEMALDQLPPAIGYESGPGSGNSCGGRKRVGSTVSVDSAVDLDHLDMELVVNDLEPSDSPSQSLRKKPTVHAPPPPPPSALASFL